MKFPSAEDRIKNYESEQRKIIQEEITELIIYTDVGDSISYCSKKINDFNIAWSIMYDIKESLKVKGYRVTTHKVDNDNRIIIDFHIPMS